MTSRENKFCCWMMESTVIVSPTVTSVMKGPGGEAPGQAQAGQAAYLGAGSRLVQLRGITQGA